DRQLVRQVGFLERDAEPLAQRITIRLPVAAQKLDLARSRRQQSFENFDGGCFARAIRPQQPKAFSRAHLKIQAVHGPDGSIVFDQAATSYGWRIVHEAWSLGKS